MHQLSPDYAMHERRYLYRLMLKEGVRRRERLGVHSAFTPANLTTLAHLSASSATNFAKSPGEPAITVPPRSASRALSFGSARPALISSLSMLTISAGILRGAPKPYHALDS